MPATPRHLNSTGCEIKYVPETGRGVYSSRHIPRNTVVEISPVLLFSKDEYENYGKHTVLDHYAFKWTNGRMALALGLGSIFNHSDTPNLSYTLDTDTDSIIYTAARDIQPEEELCIFYGLNLWFIPAGPHFSTSMESTADSLEELSGMTSVAEDDYLYPEEGDPSDIISDENLPFVRYKLPPEEEDPDSIRTVDAWVVDISEPRHIAELLKWIKQSDLETPELGHLKRVRKQGKTATLLLTISPAPPVLPTFIASAPYILPVPSSSAVTLPSLSLKSALWPTLYTPRRKDGEDAWTRGMARWAWQAMRTAVEAAIQAKVNGDLPIAACVPALETLDSITFTAHDTRTSSQHPLKHAAVNVIRQIADYQSAQSSQANEARREKGTNYLLTSRTVFLTHEPCIMCSMALLHSRVKDVIYFFPMPETGGCGGSTCLPTLGGVNHRFKIGTWKLSEAASMVDTQDLQVDNTTDA